MPDPHMHVDTAFKQQRLKAWQPILTPRSVLPTFFVLGLIFAPIGAVLYYFSSTVSELYVPGALLTPHAYMADSLSRSRSALAAQSTTRTASPSRSTRTKPSRAANTAISCTTSVAPTSNSLGGPGRARMLAR